MIAFRFLVLYFLLASSAAALLAYPAFLLAGPELFAFEKWVTRLGLLFLILGLIPARRILKLNAQDFAYPRTKSLFIQGLATGFGSGLAILLLPTVIFLALAVLVPDTGKTDPILPLLLTALVAGLLVGVIEESLFRGLFTHVILRHHSALAALVFPSTLYAAVHFMQPAHPPAGENLHWMSGFQVMTQAYLGVFSAPLDDLLALFAVGLFLGLIRLLTGNLALCIGLHASWVLLIKLIKTYTDRNRDSEWSFLVGQYDGIVGWGVCLWLLLLCLILWGFSRQRSNPKDTAHSQR